MKTFNLENILGALFSILADPLMKVGVPLAKDILAQSATMVLNSSIDAAGQRKIQGRGVVQEQKGNQFSQLERRYG